MGKILALLCMLIITAGIFFGPGFYFENIDTRLQESSEYYRYSVKIEGDLEPLEKKEMLLNYDCLVNVENTAYELDWQAAQGINGELGRILFEDSKSSEFFKNINVINYQYESMSFKLIYVDDEVIKTFCIGTYIFGIDDFFKGFALYDAATYDIYLVYVFGNHSELAGYKSILEPAELLNGRALNSIMEKTSLKAKDVLFGESQQDMLSLFKKYIEDNMKGITEQPGEGIEY